MTKLSKIQSAGQIYHTLEDFSEYFQMDKASMRVLLSRQVKSGELLRLRRDLYVFLDAYNNFDQTQLFELANVIQTPSYISYLTALSYYDMTTQIPVALIESANLMRSCQFEADPIRFNYHYCKKSLYFGFRKIQSFFVAEPEKALLDSIYLVSLGRYSLDDYALSIKNIDQKRLNNFLKKYPKRFKNYFRTWRTQYENITTT